MLIGVTGGIGSGKSVVCRICALKGIPVYDCDLRAKQLMCTHAGLRQFLIDEIGVDIFLPDGALNRPLMSRHIFSGGEFAQKLQTRIHEAVRNDIGEWMSTLTSPVAIVESAIMHTAHLDERVDRLWLVQAPEEVRIERVRARSALGKDEILRRMAVQQREFDALPAHKVSVIDNDGAKPLLPRVNELLAVITETK